MTLADQLKLLRTLSPTALATGALSKAPYVPVNTAHALYADANGRGRRDDVAQSLSTDVGRGIGAGLGSQAARGLIEHWKVEGSPLLRSAVLLGGEGIGATLGHMKGQNVGQQLFPGTFSDRMHRAVNAF